MKKLFFILFSFLSIVVNAQYYGTYFAADGMCNTTIGYDHNYFADYRFKADTSGTVSQLRIYICLNNDEGYSGGTGGTLYITLESDDGTANHYPSGAVLASITDATPLVPWDVFLATYRLYTFDAPYAITEGTIYHLRFVNLDAHPETNWISTDCIYSSFAGYEGMSPTTNISDLAVMQGHDAGGWEVRTTMLPVFTLNFSGGGQMGQGYYNQNPYYIKTINGTNYKVRSNFTVSGENKTVQKVWVRAQLVSGTDPISLRLEESDGTEIETVTIPAASFNSYMTWGGVDFTSPHILSNGSTYHLVLSTAAGTTYQAYHLSSGGPTLNYEEEFGDGHIESMTNGTDWVVDAGALDYSWKLQSYFELTTDPPEVAPTVITSSISVLTQILASGGGNVTYDGGGTVSARGVCWNTTGTPTTSDSKTTDGTGTGAFTSSIGPLVANTSYHVRAYATNGTGTSYGTEIDFTTNINSSVHAGGKQIRHNGKIVKK